MQLNKTHSILDKGKMICIKLDKLFLIMPYTYSKIEIRMRTLIMNNRHLLDGLAHFMNFYIVNFNYQYQLMKKYTDFLKNRAELEYEERFRKKKEGFLDNS